MSIAVIPARGGSKRIPRKNIRDFCGLPMIAHSIHVALQSNLFEHVVVSTDDQEIAGIAKQYGATVPFIRPADLADDHATTLDVMAHAVRACESAGLLAQRYCCLYATAPFVTAADLERGHELLSSAGVAYAFSATRFSFPVQRAIRIAVSGSIAPAWPEFIQSRSQDLEALFHDAGQFYWGLASAFSNKLPFFAAHSRAVVLPPYQVQDIDDEDDWQRAELMHAAWRSATRQQP